MVRFSVNSVGSATSAFVTFFSASWILSYFLPSISKLPSLLSLILITSTSPLAVVFNFVHLSLARI